MVAALIDEFGREAALEAMDAVCKTQRAKILKEADRAAAILRKGKDGEEAKAGRETNEKEEAKAGS